MKLTEIITESDRGPTFSFDKMYNGNYSVIDSNTYDGAPDADELRSYGEGKTKEAALKDLVDQLYDNEMYTKQELDRAVKAYQAQSGKDSK